MYMCVGTSGAGQRPPIQLAQTRQQGRAVQGRCVWGEMDGKCTRPALRGGGEKACAGLQKTGLVCVACTAGQPARAVMGGEVRADGGGCERTV